MLDYIQLTDKKENQIFLIYQEIQNGAVTTSYMANAPSYLVKYLHISYDFATDLIWISLYCIWGKYRFIFYQWLSWVKETNFHRRFSNLSRTILSIKYPQEQLI